MTAALSPGDPVRVAGWSGRFRFHGFDRDGSARLYGGPSGRYQWRNADPARVHRVRRDTLEHVANCAPPAKKAGVR